MGSKIDSVISTD